MPAATDVPGIFDCLINSQGYVFLDSQEQRARYTYTPTFLERQNVSGAYGDDAQDFFFTVSQNDWSLGEDQNYYRSQHEDRKRRFWAGSSVDPVTTPGQVTLRNTVGSLTFAAAVRGLTETIAGIYAAGTTTIYRVDSDGSLTSMGVHGLGAAPSQWGITNDSTNVYISTTGSGTVGVRRMTAAGSYSTFSATASDALAYLGNTLYGYAEDTGNLVSYSTAGAATTIYTWKQGEGTALTGTNYQTRLRNFGGKLLILRETGVRRPVELWDYDGTDVSQLAEFPSNFVIGELEVAHGVAFISGYLNFSSYKAPAIFYYVNQTMGRLWKTTAKSWTNATWPAMAAWDEGIAFTDDATGKLMLYNISTGGVHTLGSYTASNATPMMAGNKDILVHTRNATGGYYFPTSTVSSSGTVDTSLIDFENTLTKQFRGITVDASIPSGATIDISYQVDALDGSWTSLQTGAASGTEYSLSGVSGRAIAVRVTLNKGSSSAGPALRRIKVRAAPRLNTFRRGEFVIDCSGRNGKNVKLRNGSPHPLDGQTMAANLNTAITSAAPITIVDRFGSVTAYVEPKASEIIEVRPEEYVARIAWREI